MGERCLIVGGGFIGGHLASTLASGGHSVTVVSRSFSPWLLARIAAEELDLDLIEASMPESMGIVDELDAAFADRDAVFVFAGGSTPAWSAREPAAASADVLAPAVSVLDQAQRRGIPRVVLASSGGTVYGRVQEIPTPESHPTQPVSLHGVTSLALERYADFFRREHGLQTVVLRYSNVYGPGQRSRHGQGVIAAWCEAVARGETPVLIGDGSERRDYLYASDAASAAAAAVTAAPGIYNVGVGESWSLTELLDLVREATGRRFEVIHRAGRPVDVPHTELDAALFRAKTGWQPKVSIREGLDETWRWVSR